MKAQFKSNTEMKDSTLHRAKKMEKHIFSKKYNGIHRNKLLKKIETIRDCRAPQVKNKLGNYMPHPHSFCKQHKYCEICANIRRYNKSNNVYDYVENHKKTLKNKKYYSLVFTIEHKKGR
ncbi:TPA: hypothetical protein DCZ39_04590 [Patescibacteria group bacterium]|nr:hypothetical protein [Candidatus Gracilibacteria bacterium]